jgi:hypothetical protein
LTKKHFWTELAFFKVTPLSYWRLGAGLVALQSREDVADDEEEAEAGWSDDEDAVIVAEPVTKPKPKAAKKGKAGKSREKNRS